MNGPFRATAVVMPVFSASKPKTLRPLHPNSGIEAAYRKKLLRLIEEMDASVTYWVKASYRQNEPVMAQDDAVPASALAKAVQALAKRWLKQFDLAAPKLAKYFLTAVHLRTDKGLRKILRDGGFSVRFQMTPAMKDVLQASTIENVSLIKSIGSQYFSEIEGLVMRSASAGRDLGFLTKELRKRYGVTRRRAALIARDQNNKATANMNRVRQKEAGLTMAKWKHSGGGKHPRPTHVAAGKRGQLYDIDKGWFDPAVKQWIWPGTLINCRCVSVPVIKGFS